MLIKRLDVTVQSFGWSDRAKASCQTCFQTKERKTQPLLQIELLFIQVKVDSMARAYQPKRHALQPQPSVDMAELLAAREDICNVVKTSSGSSREKTVCAVNKVKETD